MIPNENPSLCCSYYDILETNGHNKKLCAVWKAYTQEVFQLAQKFFDPDWFWYQKLNIDLRKENIG